MKKIFKKLFGLGITTLTLTLGAFGCGKKEIDYDTLVGNIMDNTIYTSTSTTAITAKGNMAFKDMTPAVTEDLQMAKETYGIDLTLGVDGQLDIMLVSSLISDGKISYSNNFNTQNFSSSQESIAMLINNYLKTHTSTSEAYVDLETGAAMIKLDGAEEWQEVPSDSEIQMDNSLLQSSELVPMIMLIADTVGKENAVVTKTENGYTLDFDLALNNEVLSKVPQQYRQLIEQDGISYENILTVMRQMDNGNYAFPLHFSFTFLTQGKQYMLTEIHATGNLLLSFDKSFEELKAMGLGADNEEGLPADYEFGVSGNLDMAIDYRNHFGYQPTEIFDDSSLSANRSASANGVQ